MSGPFVERDKFEAAARRHAGRRFKAESRSFSAGEVQKRVKQFISAPLVHAQPWKGRRATIGGNCSPRTPSHFSDGKSRRLQAAHQPAGLKQKHGGPRLIHDVKTKPLITALLPPGATTETLRDLETDQRFANRSIKFDLPQRPAPAREGKSSGPAVRGISSRRYQGGVCGPKPPMTTGITQLLSKMLLKGTTAASGTIATEIRILGCNLDPYGCNNSSW